MEKMLVFIRLPLLLALLFSSLTACSSPNPLPDYRQEEIEAKLSWCDGNVELLMEVHIAAIHEGENHRDFSLEFLAPDHLTGILIKSEEGNLRIFCDEIAVDGELFSRWIRPVELLLPTGKICPIREIEADGFRLQYAQIQKENEHEIYELYLDPQTGHPHKIQCGNEILQILSFRSNT